MPNQSVAAPQRRRSRQFEKVCNKENRAKEDRGYKSKAINPTKPGGKELPKRRHLSSRDHNLCLDSNDRGNSFNEFIKGFQASSSKDKYSEVFEDCKSDSQKSEDDVHVDELKLTETVTHHAPPALAFVNHGLPSEALGTPPFPKQDLAVLASLSAPDLPSPIVDQSRFILPPGVYDIDFETDFDLTNEVQAYLRIREHLFVISPGFLDNAIDGNMRSILVDWLVQVQHYLRLSQETLYLAVRILDMVLDKREVEGGKLQLVGIAAVLIASKMEEYYPADIKKLLHLTENSYRRKELLQMEIVLFEVIDFQVNLPTCQDFLPRFCCAAFRDQDPSFLKTCQLLVDCHLVTESHSCTPPSHLSSAAVFASLLLFSLSSASDSASLSGLWTETLTHYTQYEEIELYSTAKSMLKMFLFEDLRGVFNKYRSSSQHQRLTEAVHLEASVVLRAVDLLKECIEK